MLLTDTFIASCVGHMVGDYLLQNQWMALNKSKPGMLGHLACSVHILLYVSAIATFTQIYNPIFLALVGIPHWLIDRTSFAWTLMRWKSGFDARTVTASWEIAFTAPVYIANDNTMHIVCLWVLCALWS